MLIFFEVKRCNKLLCRKLLWKIKLADLFRQVQAEEKVKTPVIVEIILNFCNLYSGMKFYPYQEQLARRLIRSVLENDGAELTALFARQMGKTTVIGITVGGMMIMLPQLANMPMFANDIRLQPFKDGLWVGIFAPSMRQAQTAYGRLREAIQSQVSLDILYSEDFNLKFSVSNGETVALTNGSFATSVSASPDSNIEGDSYKLMILDECQDISDFKIRKSISPMGAAYNSTTVKIGTSTTFVGNFYHTIQLNQNRYNEKKIPYKNHFEYDYTVGVKYNPQYAKYIEKEKYTLGENSDEFRMSYKLEWILARGMFIHDWNKYELTNGDPTKEIVEFSPEIENDNVVRKLSCVAGIDLAKESDSTVITIVEVDWDNPSVSEINKDTGEEFKAYDSLVLNWKEIDHFESAEGYTDDKGQEIDGYEYQYYEILHFINQYNVKKIMIDATKESSLSDRFRANLGDIEVIGCVFSAQFKSEMYKVLDSEIKNRRAKFPTAPTTRDTKEFIRFKEQMSRLEKNYRGQLMVCQHPDRRGERDDYPDSYALAVYGTRIEANNLKVEEENRNPIYRDDNKQRTVKSKNRITARRR